MRVRSRVASFGAALITLSLLVAIPPASVLAAIDTSVPATVAVAGDGSWTPLGNVPRLFTPRAVILNGVDDILARTRARCSDSDISPGFELDPASGITVSIDQGELRFGAVLPGYTSYSVDPDASGAFFQVPIAHSSGDCSITATTLTFLGGRVRQRLDATSIGDDRDHRARRVRAGHGAVASSFTVWSLQRQLRRAGDGLRAGRPGVHATRRRATRSSLTGSTTGRRRLRARPSTSGSATASSSTPRLRSPSRSPTGRGRCGSATSLPGSTSITVYPDATGAYLDVPIAHSSGDASTVPHDRPVHGRRGPAATGQRRRRVPRVARRTCHRDPGATAGSFHVWMLTGLIGQETPSVACVPGDHPGNGDHVRRVRSSDPPGRGQLHDLHGHGLRPMTGPAMGRPTRSSRPAPSGRSRPARASPSWRARPTRS